jgi:signal transduction histidine kinase
MEEEQILGERKGMPKILVIEDEKPVRLNILALLKAEGFQAIGAEDGQEGLKLAQEEAPNLIICDVLMPQLDGYSVLESLRKASPSNVVPFIFLTAKADKADFRQGMELGADDYLTKPFTRDELLGAIRSRLAKQENVLKLQKKIEELQQSNILKDDFVSTVTHELRAPLANIMMVADVIQSIPDPDKQRSYLEVLQVECAREMELIDDLLALQRLEVKTEVHVETLALDGWLPEVLEPFQSRIESRELRLEVQIPDDLTGLWIDSASLRRILTELLNNACKYTPPGGLIRLEVQNQPIAKGTKAITTFKVSNTAEIPDEALPQLFERFYRVPGGDRWHQGGSGLGLALVKKLIEQLEGTIEVNSQAGWTEFTVQLPAQQPKS